MPDAGDSDPIERYFRPRPESPAGPAEPAVPERPGEGVTVDGVPAPRVAVESRGPRRPRRSMSHRSAAGARRQRRFLMVTGGMSAFVLVTSGGAWAFQSYVAGSLDKVEVGGLGGDDGPKGAMTILVAGVDRREGLTREQQKAARLGNEPGERSDTMMLVRVSREHDRIAVVSLPRDSLVTIPAHRSNGSEGAKGTPVPSQQGKLTWAYQYGGPDLTVATVKRATGMSIDHYVEVNFYGFVNMVDAIGGVDVCVEQPVYDKKSGLRLNAGTTHVDGLKALAFTRARYSIGNGSDLGRIDRQQQFMASLLKQALSSKTLSDPVKSTRFLNSALKTLRVDKKLAENLPGLANQMKDLSPDSVTFVKIPLKSDNYMTPINGSAPQSTVLWDQDKAADMFSRLRRDQPFTKPSPTAAATPTRDPNAPTVQPRDISVVVRNGVGTRGLAAKAAGDLREVGFRTTVPPGVARTGLKVTQIQYGPAQADSARTLAAAIPGAKLKKVSALGDTVQIIVGADWRGAEEVEFPSLPGASPTGSGPETSTASQKLCK
ncbi:cell envelope-related function transcriptional attenuator common domain-containing protein [Thermomonospora echinospora]|uniref:Cell envelope-related function transcriptional attenuator common domain-containing protein n=1 Tax=Thermomonospora echinospora TaxID=1992 RepID=A0A1H6E103_9ACTN|nr:LCP family protein [Thermomonospora echinospora]SEG90843.1 cell envelope-related function transcriptional attenuator common domain-containing protein [Thermomonospora echinospora]